MGETFGDLTTESIFNKYAEKIRAGAFRVSKDLQQEIGVAATGTFAQGESALSVFLFECRLSGDNAVKKWASAYFWSIADSLSIPKKEFLQMTLRDLYARLVPPPKSEHSDQTASEKSWGAQGQTKKPGSHSESRHSR